MCFLQVFELKRLCIKPIIQGQAIWLSYGNSLRQLTGLNLTKAQRNDRGFLGDSWVSEERAAMSLADRILGAPKPYLCGLLDL